RHGVAGVRPDPGDLEAGVAQPARLEAGDLRVFGLAQQARHVGVGLGAQRVLSVYLEDQVHAAPKVEAQVDLLLGRIGEDHDGHGDRQDQQPTPEQIAVDFLSPLSPSPSREEIAALAIFTLTLSAIFRMTAGPSTETTSPYSPPVVTTRSPFFRL